MGSSSTRSSDKSSAAEFFGRHTLEVARDLLGRTLEVRAPQGQAASVRRGRIVEVEAYRAGDPASHSARGPTPRSQIMFGPPGHAYVYLIYGMYRMLNFVTEAPGHPGAVLVRAVELEGEPYKLGAGPGRLTRALGVEMSDNGASLTGPRFYVAPLLASPPPRKVGSVVVSPRVGIRSGQDRLWRFWLDGTPSLSPAPENRLARPLTRDLWKRILSGAEG